MSRVPSDDAMLNLLLVGLNMLKLDLRGGGQLRAGQDGRGSI